MTPKDIAEEEANELYAAIRCRFTLYTQLFIKIENYQKAFITNKYSYCYVYLFIPFIMAMINYHSIEKAKQLFCRFNTD